MLRMARAAARNPKRASSIRMLRAQVRTEYVERVAFFLGSFAKVGQRTLMQAAVAVWAVHVTLWKVRWALCTAKSKAVHFIPHLGRQNLYLALIVGSALLVLTHDFG